MKKKINKKKLLGVIVRGVGLDFANKKSYQIKQIFILRWAQRYGLWFLRKFGNSL